MTGKAQGFLVACTLVFFTGCNTGDGTCGDGILQRSRGETCEPELLLEATCETLGYYPGTLACSDDCGYSYVGCGGFCGDGRVQADFGEVCDAGDLAGQTCVSLGFNGGTLACNADCTTLDASGCELLAMIEIPAGTFQRDDDPANLSTVSAFLMSRTEITRWQYRLMTGHDPTDETSSSGPGDPVRDVTWSDAAVFCNLLSRHEGLTPVYPSGGGAIGANLMANGYRLPTEMEWRWAAMGADLDDPGEVNTTGWSRAFAGDDGTLALGDYAVFGYGTGEPGATRYDSSEPACSRLPNELELCDLSGNVMEWTQDWFAPIPPGPLTDYVSTDLITVEFAVTGGSWRSPAERCTLAYRRGIDPNLTGITSSSIGFRVVRRP